jgi:hypothetical protein
VTWCGYAVPQREDALTTSSLGLLTPLPRRVLRASIVALVIVAALAGCAAAPPTVGETRALGFDVLRRRAGARRYAKVNRLLVSGQIDAPLGAAYRVGDRRASADGARRAVAERAAGAVVKAEVRRTGTLLRYELGFRPEPSAAELLAGLVEDLARSADPIG